MTLRAAAHNLVVTPTGDDSETEQGGLIVVNHEKPKDAVRRGVVEDIGGHVPEKDDGLAVGCVAHYVGFYTLQDKHIIAPGGLIAWEPDE